MLNDLLSKKDLLKNNTRVEVPQSKKKKSEEMLVDDDSHGGDRH